MVKMVNFTLYMFTTVKAKRDKKKKNNLKGYEISSQLGLMVPGGEWLKPSKKVGPFSSENTGFCWW